MSNWTPDRQAAWEEFWKSDAGSIGLLLLKEACRVPAGPIVAEPGIDLKEVASQSYAFAQGESHVFEEIEKLKPKKIVKPLPPPFERTPRPTPQPEP